MALRYDWDITKIIARDAQGGSSNGASEALGVQGKSGFCRVRGGKAKGGGTCVVWMRGEWGKRDVE